MVGRLILGLIWLTCVHSDTPNIVPMEEASIAGGMATTIPAADDSSPEVVAPLTKAKRYLSHRHSSPCPPFYPHFGVHVPMHAMRPYGPPAYPRTDYGMPVHQGHHRTVQLIDQPSYSSYAPKQTVQYVKQVSAPVYHLPVASPAIRHVQPIFEQSPPSYYHRPMIEHKVSYEKQPVFAYAPAYHKPMPMIWQGPQIKKIDYPVTEISYPKPTIVYKPEAPKCAPCPSIHQPQAFHRSPQPSISYVKVAQPAVHRVAHSPPKVYMPAPVHQPVVKPCDE